MIAKEREGLARRLFEQKVVRFFESPHLIGGPSSPLCFDQKHLSKEILEEIALIFKVIAARDGIDNCNLVVSVPRKGDALAQFVAREMKKEHKGLTRASLVDERKLLHPLPVSHPNLFPRGRRAIVTKNVVGRGIGVRKTIITLMVRRYGVAHVLAIASWGASEQLLQKDPCRAVVHALFDVVDLCEFAFAQNLLSGNPESVRAAVIHYAWHLKGLPIR